MTRTCLPCRKGDPALTPDERQRHLATLADWHLNADNTAITREVTFSNFRDALAFVTALSAIAEEENHHPDIAFGWGYARITFTTHAIGGLHMNDIIMARHTDAIIPSGT